MADSITQAISFCKSCLGDRQFSELHRVAGCVDTCCDCANSNESDLSVVGYGIGSWGRRRPWLYNGFSPCSEVAALGEPVSRSVMLGVHRPIGGTVMTA